MADVSMQAHTTAVTCMRARLLAALAAGAWHVPNGLLVALRSRMARGCRCMCMWSATSAGTASACAHRLNPGLGGVRPADRAVAGRGGRGAGGAGPQQIIGRGAALLHFAAPLLARTCPLRARPAGARAAPQSSRLHGWKALLERRWGCCGVSASIVVLQRSQVRATGPRTSADGRHRLRSRRIDLIASPLACSFGDGSSLWRSNCHIAAARSSLARNRTNATRGRKLSIARCRNVEKSCLHTCMESDHRSRCTSICGKTRELQTQCIDRDVSCHAYCTQYNQSNACANCAIPPCFAETALAGAMCLSIGGTAAALRRYRLAALPATLHPSAPLRLAGAHPSVRHVSYEAACPRCACVL